MEMGFDPAVGFYPNLKLSRLGEKTKMAEVFFMVTNPEKHLKIQIPSAVVTCRLMIFLEVVGFGSFPSSD